MKQIGSYQARTHFSKLLAQVKRGETFTITNNGEPVAVLSPTRFRDADKIQSAIEGIKKLSANLKLGKVKIKTLIEEGRS